jgi:hypothetical protein
MTDTQPTERNGVFKREEVRSLIITTAVICGMFLVAYLVDIGLHLPD